jgi:amino acid adenylation domain-containing protein
MNPTRALLPELFEAQVRRTPEAIALVCGPETLTYAELNARSNRLAHWLIGQGAGPEQLVAVRMRRSADLVVALLAVLKTGAAYVPVDPEYPAERIAFMLDDARSVLVLRSGEEPAARLLADLPSTNPSDSDRLAPLHASNASYVIYTSGSTGSPKGVVVSHDALSIYLTYACAAYPSVAGIALLHSPVAFDLSVTVLYAPLICGGSLHVIDLAPNVTAVKPTFLKVTPSHLALLDVLPGDFSPAGHLVVGGETLLGEAIHDLRLRNPGVTVINEYGPTEATVGCSVLRIGPDEEVMPGRVPIGLPTWETELYVLDDELRPVPPGATGELYIAGSQLARGYLNRPDLTSERFVANPFSALGTRMYRTGDIVRVTPNGDLDCLGRVDDQVKIRGFRIELAEVESALLRCPDIAQAAAAVHDDGSGGKRLVGYLVPATDGEIDLAILRAHLAGTLPQYMVPAALVRLETLPLTPNGKLDRKALPMPARQASFREPVTPREKLLCELFAQALGVPRVSVDEDFFDAGGTSMLAVQFLNTLRESGIALTLRDITDHRTAERLAAMLNQMDS